MQTNMTPELINYAKTIVAERNISQAQMTPALMGEVLKEAVRRMDAAVTRYMSNKQAQVAMFEAIFFNVKIG
jgi:hypothetical protein